MNNREEVRYRQKTKKAPEGNVSGCHSFYLSSHIYVYVILQGYPLKFHLSFEFACETVYFLPTIAGLCVSTHAGHVEVLRVCHMTLLYCVQAIEPLCGLDKLYALFNTMRWLWCHMFLMRGF